jgi:DNA invertase Pin-like site-specific DNA recombinase
MRLAAYLRVSSKGQIDAWGLDRQERAVKQWARTNGHKIASWHRDEGVSGTIEAVDRPGLTDAISRVTKHVDGVLIADLDRLARSLTVQEACLGVIWRAGGRLFTATGGEVLADDPDDPSRTLIRQVMGSVIEYEKNQAVRRMRLGREAKAAEGKHAVGDYAYGYAGHGDGRGRDAAPAPAEQIAVRRIAELRAAGRSYRLIAAALDAEGLAPRRAAQWSAMSVRNVAERLN